MLLKSSQTLSFRSGVDNVSRRLCLRSVTCEKPNDDVSKMTCLLLTTATLLTELVNLCPTRVSGQEVNGTRRKRKQLRVRLRTVLLKMARKCQIFQSAPLRLAPTNRFCNISLLRMPAGLNLLILIAVSSAGSRFHSRREICSKSFSNLKV